MLITDAAESFIEGIYHFLSRFIRTYALVLGLPFTIQRILYRRVENPAVLLSPRAFAFLNAILLVPTISFLLSKVPWENKAQGKAIDSLPSLIETYKIASLEDSLLRSGTVLLCIALLSSLARLMFSKNAARADAAYDLTCYNLSGVSAWCFLPCILVAETQFGALHYFQDLMLLLTLLLISICLPLLIPSISQTVIIGKLCPRVKPWILRQAAGILLSIPCFLGVIGVPIAAGLPFFVFGSQPSQDEHVHVHFLSSEPYYSSSVPTLPSKKLSKPEAQDLRVFVAIRNTTSETIGVVNSFQLLEVAQEEEGAMQSSGPLHLQYVNLPSGGPVEFVDPGKVLALTLKVSAQDVKKFPTDWATGKDSLMLRFGIRISAKLGRREGSFKDGTPFSQDIGDKGYVLETIQSQGFSLSDRTPSI